MLTSLRVLLVHDTAAADLVLDTLRTGGLTPTWQRVDTAEGLREALAAATWEVALCADLLPAVTATAALGVLAEQAPDLPMLVLAGAAGEEQALEAMRLGAKDYVPLANLARLVPAVRRELGATAQRREHRQAEQRSRDELAQSGTLLQILAEETTDALFVKDRNGKYLLFNQAAARFVGKPVDAVLGNDDRDLFDPDSARLVMERDRHVMANGLTETREETLSVAGVVRTYLSTKGPCRDGAGEITGLFGISRDITERKQAEERLRASEARFRALVEKSYDGILLLDALGTVLYASPSAGRIIGRLATEYLGHKVYDFKPPEDATRCVADLAEITCKPGSTWTGQTRLVHVDGSFRHVEATMTNLLGDPDVGAVIVNFRDVTERLRAEAAIRLRDRALRAVASGIVIADVLAADQPIIFASEGFERLTGYPAAEVLGRNCRFLQGKDTERDLVTQLRQAIQAGQPCEVELLNYRKDGSSFWNGLLVSPIHDDQGRLTHFVGVQSDVTERRRLEEQFRQAQKMEAIGRLAGGVAHDFNNLLTVINGFGEIVLDTLAEDHPARDLVRQIKDAGERAAALTRQLLAFSRKTVLEPKLLDLNHQVRAMEKLLHRLIGEDIDLATCLDARASQVKADPSQLEHAVINLAVNARDAMPQGGRLTIETRTVELDHAYAHDHPEVRPGSYVMLAVTDTGHGMDAETRGRIFEPFFTTKKPGQGTGLGLAMVYGFVKQSGGQITVTSEPGKGTTISLYLPRADGPVPAPRKYVPAEPLPQGTETILLVEDEPGVRTLARQLLRGCGYTVLEAAHGREAVQVAEGHTSRIDLLVTDVVMPQGMGGRQVAEAVTALHSEAKVLFVSGYTDDAIVRHGVLEAHANFLQKPFTAASLARKVRDILDRPTS